MSKRLLEFYRKYRNKLNSLTFKQKREHLKNEIQKANNDKKKIWSLANEVTCFKGPRTHGPSKIEINDTLLEVDKFPLEIASNFNHYYSNVGISASGHNPTNKPSLCCS